MPTISVSEKELRKMSGVSGELEGILSVFKAEIEKKQGDELSIEFKDTNRPDLFSVEGLARAMKVHRTSKITGYKISGKGVEIKKKKVSVRPFIAACVVKGVKLSDSTIAGIMQFQDNLDRGIGRKRKKTSIGLYDFNKVTGPVIYKTTGKTQNAFIPLNETKKMTPEEILKNHEKGREYGQIIKNDEYPIFTDSKKQVLSFPPIINSNVSGKITRNTKNILVEVTGTDERTVIDVLGLICFALVERRGKIYSGSLGSKKFPDINRKRNSFSLTKLKEIAGFEIKDYEKCLKKMDYKFIKKTGNNVVVDAPVYRTDIISEVDIIEDIIIANGYEKIIPEIPNIMTVGEYDDRVEKQRMRMVGSGFQEVQTFMLINPELINKLGMDKILFLENPINENYSALRSSLIPGILDFLSKNTHIEYPQDIFEVGEVVNTKASSSINLCGASSNSNVDFTLGKQVLEAVFDDIEFKPIERDPFIKGRCAEIKIKDKSVGVLGEIHPKYLDMLGISNPIVLFEVELIDKIL